MAHYRLEVDVNAPRERVFDLWIDLDRMVEWVGGVTGVSEVSGPVDRAGTTYVVHFGGVGGSRTEVLAAERPSLFRTRFGTWLLRGESEARFDDVDGRTRLVQEFDIQGLVPNIAARIFGMGSYKGSFQGELEAFKAIAEREASGDGRLGGLNGSRVG
jgi:uncharacterized protein YndB with AHSA1/START domain